MNTQKPDPNKFADLVLMQLAGLRAEITLLPLQMIELKLAGGKSKEKLLAIQKKYAAKTRKLESALHAEFRVLVGLR